MELSKSDWENVKKHAENQIKDCMITLAVFRNTLWMAEKEIKKFPDDEKDILGRLKPMSRLLTTEEYNKLSDDDKKKLSKDKGKTEPNTP